MKTCTCAWRPSARETRNQFAHSATSLETLKGVILAQCAQPVLGRIWSGLFCCLLLFRTHQIARVLGMLRVTSPPFVSTSSALRRACILCILFVAWLQKYAPLRRLLTALCSISAYFAYFAYLFLSMTARQDWPTREEATPSRGVRNVCKVCRDE